MNPKEYFAEESYVPHFDNEDHRLKMVDELLDDWSNFSIFRLEENEETPNFTKSLSGSNYKNMESFESTSMNENLLLDEGDEEFVKIESHIRFDGILEDDHENDKNTSSSDLKIKIL